MKINKVWAIYFSPNGNTKKVVSAMAQAVSAELSCSLETLDFTLLEARKNTYAFEATDLVFWAVPVYAGRVPNKLLGFLEKHIKANAALGVAVTVYGNRSYDDALFELSEIMKADGFDVIAGAGIVAKHAFSTQLAGSRPDEADLNEFKSFARRVVEKLEDPKSLKSPVVIEPLNTPIIYYTPKGIDGETTVFLKAKPQTDASKCTQCMLCVDHCPMAAFESGSPLEATGTCIKCYACVNACEPKAKAFTDPAFISHKAMLEANFTRRKENAFFI